VRERLARLALEAALATPGVLAPNAGVTGLHATWIAGGRLPGVRVIASAGETWSVELGLTAGLVPLRPLADAVRGRVEHALALAGLRGAVSEVDVALLAVEEGDRLPTTPAVPAEAMTGTAAPEGAVVE